MPFSALHRETFAEKQGNTWSRGILSSRAVLVWVLATRQQEAARVNTAQGILLFVSIYKRNARKTGTTSSHEALVAFCHILSHFVTLLTSSIEG